MDIGDRLKKVRKTLGITQKEMGEPIGLKKENIRDLESGKVKFSTLHALAIEHVFNVSANWMLTGEGVMLLEIDSPKEATNGLPMFNESIPHSLMVEYFQQKDLAKKINWKLIRYEKADPKFLVEIDDYIDLRSKHLKIDENDAESKQQGRGAGKMERRKKEA